MKQVYKEQHALFTLLMNERLVNLTEERRVRVLNLGSDSHNRTYWYFSNDKSRIYVEEPVVPMNATMEAARSKARIRAQEATLEWKELVESGGLTLTISAQALAAQKREQRRAAEAMMMNDEPITTTNTAAAAATTTTTTTTTVKGGRGEKGAVTQEAIIIDGEIIADEGGGDDDALMITNALDNPRPASRQSLLNLSRPPSSMFNDKDEGKGEGKGEGEGEEEEEKTRN
jgi:hypothetical protein